MWLQPLATAGPTCGHHRHLHPVAQCELGHCCRWWGAGAGGATAWSKCFGRGVLGVVKANRMDQSAQSEVQSAEGKRHTWWRLPCATGFLVGRFLVKCPLPQSPRLQIQPRSSPAIHENGSTSNQVRSLGFALCSPRHSAILHREVGLSPWKASQSLPKGAQPRKSWEHGG